MAHTTMDVDHDLTAPWEFSDFILMVEDKQIHVMKSLIMMGSPVFKAMLSGHFLEKNSKMVALPGKSFQEILILMRLVHPTSQEITDGNVYQVLHLADEYQILQVMMRCRDFLMTKPGSVHHLALASRYNWDSMKRECMTKVLKCPISSLEKDKHFSEITDSVKRDFFEKKAKLYESTLTSVAVQNLLNASHKKCPYHKSTNAHQLGTESDMVCQLYRLFTHVSANYLSDQ